MRCWIAIFICGLLVGCASEQPVVETGTSAGGPTASALAFDAPITLYQPEVVVYRDSRGPGAFAGYEDSITTYAYVHTEDRQTTDSSDRYRNEAEIDTVTVAHR